VHTTNIAGLDIAYERDGEGPPLVLLHGFLCDSRVWRTQIDDLSDDFDVITWDAPGCGRSSDPGEEFTMADYADCLAAFLERLGVRDAHVCGLSWGGMCALDFYRRFPGRVRSLILADCYAGWSGSLGKEAAEQRLSLCLRQSEMPAAEWVPGFVAGAVSDSASIELRKRVAEIISEFHPVGFRGDVSRVLSRLPGHPAHDMGSDTAPLGS
jgi:pimeloyl-ACP methyl ester carboxylesterase